MMKGANVYINSATYTPTRVPTPYPTIQPTRSPSVWPSVPPTIFPTSKPTYPPTSTPTNYPSIFPTKSPTSYPFYAASSNVEENCTGIVGDLWTLVRHAPAGRKWHLANDDLKGTAVYGTPDGPNSTDFWSKQYDTESFDQFLFTRDDCEKWLITSKKAVFGNNGNAYYADGLRTIIASSDSSTSYQARWYRRSNHAEDPLISIIDHHIAGDKMVYAEANQGCNKGCPQMMKGANVYINSASYTPRRVP